MTQPNLYELVSNLSDTAKDYKKAFEAYAETDTKVTLKVESETSGELSFSDLALNLLDLTKSLEDLREESSRVMRMQAEIIKVLIAEQQKLLKKDMLDHLNDCMDKS